MNARCDTNILQIHILNDPNPVKETLLHNHCSGKLILNKLPEFFTTCGTLAVIKEVIIYHLRERKKRQVKNSKKYQTQQEKCSYLSLGPVGEK